MGLFSRRRDDDVTGDGEVADAAAQDEAAEDPRSEAAGDGRGTSRGPWDVSEVPDLGARLDLGALRIPGLVGMQLRMEMDQNGSRAVAVNLGFEGSALQVQAFAAPRTYGIWEELRAELAGSVTRQGGTADEVPGPFGTELLARLPVRTPDGQSGHRPARFVGVDGPRWFLRGVLTGKAAVDPASAARLEAVFGEVVVVRGDEARAPRDLLPLHLPGRGPAGPAGSPAVAVPTADVLERGPEITETR
jgi:hypothetical protein